MSRIIVPALDEILGKKFHTLNGQGWFRAMDYMGGDDSVVNAARNTIEGATAIHDSRGLMRYLMRHWHSTPFEFATITLQVYVPMDCWRQWIRHRMFSVNEYSTRYSEAINECQTTPSDKWRLQSQGNRQGSSGEYLRTGDEEDANTGEKTGQYFSDREHRLHQFSREVYQERLDRGIANEQARKDLPLSNFTLAYWTGDLWNLLHFLHLRMDSHAQAEIREYATMIGEEIVAQWAPRAYEAFTDYRYMAQQLSRLEFVALAEINKCLNEHPNKTNQLYVDYRPVYDLVQKFDWLDYESGPRDAYSMSAAKPNRERAEFEVKLRDLNMVIPWAQDEGKF